LDFPEASGWRAMASIAEPPILPIPKPAPITINPAPTKFKPIIYN
jgi:hypothetical protein